MNSKELKILNGKVSDACLLLSYRLDNITTTHYFSNLLNLNIKEVNNNV